MNAAAERTLYDRFPGFEVPVGDLLRWLATLWDMAPGEGVSAPSEYRASQMNLVVHFGRQTTPGQALAVFETVLKLGRRYPCRALLLCPVVDGRREGLSAKVFSECYIGESRHEMTCCEVLVMEYPEDQRGYLENQTSILLESDLPLYYWPHRFCSPRLLSDYRFFLGQANRVIVDSALDVDALGKLDWPEGTQLRDLAYARLLPVRQSLGQFLAGIEPAVLAGGVDAITVRPGSGCRAEARVLLDWLAAGVADCRAVAGRADGEVRPILEDNADDGSRLEIRWRDAGGRTTLEAEFDFEVRQGRMEAHFVGGSPPALLVTARLLEPEMALAEALLF